MAVDGHGAIAFVMSLAGNSRQSQDLRNVMCYRGPRPTRGFRCKVTRRATAWRLRGGNPAPRVDRVQFASHRYGQNCRNTPTGLP